MLYLTIDLPLLDMKTYNNQLLPICVNYNNIIQCTLYGACTSPALSLLHYSRKVKISDFVA